MPETSGSIVAPKKMTSKRSRQDAAGFAGEKRVKRDIPVETTENVTIAQLSSLLTHVKKVVTKSPDFALKLLTQNGIIFQLRLF